MAVHLMQHTSRDLFEVRALSLFNPKDNILEHQLADSGIAIDFLAKRLGPDVSMLRKIDRVLRTYRPHVVHTHRYALKYALPAMLCRRIPAMVHTVHSIAEREVGRASRLIHGFGFRRGVVPVSIANEVTESIRRVYEIDSFPCIPNGIPVSSFAVPMVPRETWRQAQGFSADAVIYACVARLSAPKNHQLLLDAFAQGPAKCPNAYLLLVGEGDRRGILTDRVSQLGLSDRVRFLGQSDDVVSVLHAADVFVLASHWEGNPLSVMEAMAAGKAVVCTAVGGVPELVRNGIDGLLVPGGDQGALSRALIDLAETKALREKWGLNARVRAQDFDVTIMAQAYEMLYQSLLGPQVGRNDL